LIWSILRTCVLERDLADVAEDELLVEVLRADGDGGSRERAFTATGGGVVPTAGRGGEGDSQDEGGQADAAK
jgi:hypothetical protein